MHRSIETGLRLFLGGVFILYAMLHFLNTQLPRVELHQPIDQVAPATLVWYFFGYSQPYMIAIATGELLVGLLIIISKTARIGILFYCPFALHIALINWCFNQSTLVKTLSTFLAISSFVLLINHLPFYRKIIAQTP